MKTFRNLYLHLHGVDIDDLSEQFTRRCQPPWFRNVEKEDDLGLLNETSFCFERQKGDGLLPAALFLYPMDSNTWYVSNIVPTDTSELSYDQYNEILEEFLQVIVQPEIKNTTVEAEITSNEITIGSVAGKGVEDALVRFSSLANKSTGNAHPSDRKRWFEFLILANKSASELDADLVIRTLIEQGWSEEKAYDLGLQFEIADDLLSYYREW